jgi:SAM-dependent methyltransferase
MSTVTRITEDKAALSRYRASEKEIERTRDLLQIFPRGYSSVLDIGARDGHFSRLLADVCDQVIALDLSEPDISHPKIQCVAGDATNLTGFADQSVDVVFCAEVLEHIPRVDDAARELARVARHHVVIGVPYRQDLRLGRTTCVNCENINPPWGHVHEFDEHRLQSLFPSMAVTSTSFVGQVHGGATNVLSVWLHDLGRNPWGVYDQQEPCSSCGSKLIPPTNRTLFEKACSGVATRLNRLQSRFEKPRSGWIHMVFSR